MAGGMDLGGGGKGGKKPLDATINLVPFIDLMAVTIVFLIMTAVWTQIGRLQVSNSGQNAGEEAPPPDQAPPVNLLITDRELKLSVGGSQLDPILISRDAKDRLEVSTLIAKLKEIKQGQTVDQGNITLQPEDTVRYEDLVRVIDTCVGNGFAAVAVSPASA